VEYESFSLRITEMRICAHEAVPTWEEYVKKSGLSEQQALIVVETVEEMSAEEREAAFTGIMVICCY
jgi:hypothetical protein